MARKLFVNIAVKDLDASVDFFTKLGFIFNPEFTDSNATCMLVGEDAYVMLLVRDFYKTFTDKQLADPFTTSEALLSISATSREEVDTLVDTAVAAGGVASSKKQVEEWMYGWGFQDLDGHQWEVMWMDPGVMD